MQINLKIWQEKIINAKNTDELEQIRINALGKSGEITLKMKELNNLNPESRKEFGQLINNAKNTIASLIEEKSFELKKNELNARLVNEKVDVTLPIRPIENQGKIHPNNHVYEEMVAIFAQMGFEVANGPEIEDEWHNFTALNIAANHPARQMHDTFYLNEEKKANEDDNLVLRTHTSPVQIRTMLSKKPPIKIIVPGNVYRCDYDATHTPMFHQIEGLVIDKKATFAELKGCLLEFAKAFFEVDELPIRFRPSYFPFTEPSAEADIGCKKDKKGLKIGNYGDWMEFVGCGMVHPNVLKACGLDPEEYQGYAFGLGMDRMAMLKYGLPDLRQFFENDVRWLKHYGFDPLQFPSMTLGL